MSKYEVVTLVFSNHQKTKVVARDAVWSGFILW